LSSLKSSNNYKFALLTVDTEALPKRAPDCHVDRLIWGGHSRGSAGIREICSIGDEFGIKHVFFVDMCGAYEHLAEMKEVVRWLEAAGQDVQLHAHPEYLPNEFWTSFNLKSRPKFMNQYQDQARSSFIIGHFRDLIVSLTGKPVRAFRAGSFRWNAGAIMALGELGIPLSFNNSFVAMRLGQCPFSLPTGLPFEWSNGILEIPATEGRILPWTDRWWDRLRYPESKFFRFRPRWGPLAFNIFIHAPNFAVFLLHSWSFLHRDQNGYEVYRNDAPMEGYRRLLKKLKLDYEVITTTELLELRAMGKLPLGQPVDLNRAELNSAPALRAC
jgi:hypothetical protein